MSIFDSPTNRLEEHLINVFHYQLYLESNGPDKNEAFAPEFALDEVE